MKKKILSITISAIIVVNSGCATILSGSRQKVTFDCNERAKVYQNLTEVGSTNTPIPILRRDMVKLYTIKAEGCIDQAIELPVRFNTVGWLNLPFVVLFGSGILLCYIDVALGNEVKTDNIIKVELDCPGKK